jgi:aldehyde dehydrogenase (NAD+)
MSAFEQVSIEVHQKQQTFFNAHKTQSYEFRHQQLSKLRELIIRDEAKILAALAADLGKHAIDAYLAEIGFVLGELDFTLKKMHRWMRPKKVPGPWVQFPSRNLIQPVPFGNVLIIGPWNYPFQLTIGTLIGAWSAGNTAILKPSELAPATSKVIEELINNNFDAGLAYVAQGGVAETTILLNQKFDYIFYTGSTQVGRIVMQKAAHHLTPVTLELGGKSPCFVFGCSDLKTTAKRIAWGKFMNAGQTCVAPDYILVESSKRDELIQHLKSAITEFYSENPLQSPFYCKIVNQRHFDRLKALIEPQKVVFGGSLDSVKQQIAPTLLKDDGSGLAMKEEIFGPLLPIIAIDKIDDAIAYVSGHDRPLALYVFSDDNAIIDNVMAKTISGGVCINDCIVHMSTPYMPFGGVGASGMGAYHGVYSFETFSHKRSIMVRSLWPDLFLRYPPYKIALKWFKVLLKFLSH